jgi:hypothetical protein
MIHYSFGKEKRIIDPSIAIRIDFWSFLQNEIWSKGRWIVKFLTNTEVIDGFYFAIWDVSVETRL